MLENWMSNGMDRDQKEMTVAENEIVGDVKLKGKDCDLSINQEILASSKSLASSNLFYRDLDGDGVSRCKISLAGSGVPSTIPYCMNDAGNVAEELTARNYKIPNSNLGKSSITTERLNYWQGQWHHLYKLSDGSTIRDPQCGLRDKDNMLLSSEEALQRMSFDLQDGKRLLTKKHNRDRDEVSARSIENYNKILRSNILPLGDNQSNVSSNFPQFLAKQSLKGKGVQLNSNKALTEFSIADISQNKDQHASLGKVAFDASLRSSAEFKKCSDIADLESYHDGVSLREWLKVGNFEINKVERLHLFRQIVQLVDFAHLRGVALQDLHLSCFLLLPSKRVIYSGRLTQIEMSVINQNVQRKRSLEQEICLQNISGVKQQKLEVDMKFIGHQSQLSSRCGISTVAENEIDSSMTSVRNFDDTECKAQSNFFSCQKTFFQAGLGSNYVTVQLEKKWYACPEKLNKRGLLISNVYSLGVLLFELLCCFNSSEVHSEAMLDLRHLIFPSKFLSENPIEAGICLWLLHPEPSSRPTTREILQSEIICGSKEFSPEDNLSSWTDKDDDAESELLLFLNSLEEQKKKQTSNLLENIACLEADIKEFEERYVLNKPSDWMDNVCVINPRNNTNSGDVSRSFSTSNNPAGILVKNLSQLQHAYFYMRSQHTETAAMSRPDKNVLINHDRLARVKTENEKSSMEGRPVNCFGAFFESICKFARYKKFDVRGTLKNGNLLNSASVICSLSFDREEDYIATAEVSKKIKVFEFASLMDETVDIHYPVVEMLNKSKLSCVCWNKYIKNYLASTDYDGVVQMWDASTGQGFSQYIEHQKRAWSVDFSQVDPMKFASGSDDCSIKMWSINEKSSIGTISNRANVCCVQFSPYSSHLLAFGSADFKAYCYDLRHTRIPWCTLAGHGKAVSYVKFLDSETVVSASTDNTLKLWDLNKTSLEGFSSNACSSTFTGHTNEKNFVGLSVLNGYIACGSETNEVYAYYRSLPMPITTHKFGSVDPISGQETIDNNEPFVSSVCWREKYNMVVAANSSGRIELLQMV